MRGSRISRRVAVACGPTVLDGDMCIEISEYAVVIEQRVVNVEQEYDVARPAVPPTSHSFV